MWISFFPSFATSRSTAQRPQSAEWPRNFSAQNCVGKMERLPTLFTLAGVPQILEFFFFQGCTHSLWKFPGQGWNQSCSCQPMLQPQQCGIQLTPQFMATSDPPPTEQSQGWNPCPHGYQSDSFPLSHDGNCRYYRFCSQVLVPDFSGTLGKFFPKFSNQNQDDGGVSVMVQT